MGRAHIEESCEGLYPTGGEEPHNRAEEEHEEEETAKMNVIN